MAYIQVCSILMLLCFRHWLKMETWRGDGGRERKRGGREEGRGSNLARGALFGSPPRNFQTLYQRFFVLGTSLKFFDSLFSRHDNGNEDRIWKWTESDISQADRNRGVTLGTFGASNPTATAYDVKWTFLCPQGQALVGLAAGNFRRNNERDRRWRYQCRRINGLRTTSPSVYDVWTDWANDWDKERVWVFGCDCSLQIVSKLCVLSLLYQVVHLMGYIHIPIFL